jgi:hypothetical protein
MSEQPTLTDKDEMIGTGVPEAAAQDDVQGHSILHQGLQRPPATSRNAERPSGSGCRTPGRDPHSRRGER